MSALVDPKLEMAIRKEKAGNGQVHAAFTLRGTNGKVVSPEETGRIVKKIVRKASRETKKSAAKVVVFKNLQSFSIEAPADLVERLAREDDIGTAALGS